jgi:predicted metal-binding membrane protein
MTHLRRDAFRERYFRLLPGYSLRWSRTALLVALIALSAGAWALTIHDSRTMTMPMGIAGTSRDAAGDDAMAGMDDMASSGMSAMGWSFDDAAAFLAVWAVMMAAMMLPSVTPMLLLFQNIQTKRRGTPGFVSTWIFLSGYLLIWSAIGVVAYLAVRLGSDLASRLSDADREKWAPIALGITLMASGLYQLTPLKRVCLDHCRSPLGFVMGHWRDGRFGAMRMGLRHGGYCLGCCWALFAVLVATGVMSIAWMILLTLVVFAEKVFPLGRRLSPVIGAAFILIGLAVSTGVIQMT